MDITNSRKLIIIKGVNKNNPRYTVSLDIENIVTGQAKPRSTDSICEVITNDKNQWKVEVFVRPKRDRNVIDCITIYTETKEDALLIDQEVTRLYLEYYDSKDNV